MRSKKYISSTIPKQNYGLLTATFIVVANIIGAGIFTTSGIMAKYLPSSGWVILCWLFGGLIAISGSLCYTELATRMPQSGGEYIYLKKLYHPVFGFLTGWISFFVGFSVPISLSALGFAEYLLTAVKTDLPVNDGISEAILRKSIAVAVILIFTALHYVGHRLGGRVQNFLTIIKIAIIVLFSLGGLFFGSGDWSNINFQRSTPSGEFALGSAMLMVMYSYSGWNASGYIAGELKNPKKVLPISLTGGTAIVIILFLLINIFYFYAAPFDDLKGKIAVADAAARKAFGTWMLRLMSIIISILLLSSLSAFVMIGPRVYHAMAKDRLFFSFAGQVHPRYGVPGKAIIVQGTIAMFMVIIGSFEQLLIYIGFALGIFPWIAILGLFKARRYSIGESTAVKAWGYPFTPLFFLISSFALMTVAYINKPFESTVAVITVILGLPIYYIWRKLNRYDINR